MVVMNRSRSLIVFTLRGWSGLVGIPQALINVQLDGAVFFRKALGGYFQKAFQMLLSFARLGQFGFQPFDIAVALTDAILQDLNLRPFREIASRWHRGGAAIPKMQIIWAFDVSACAAF